MKAFLFVATASATRSAGYKALEDFIAGLKVSSSTEPETLAGSWCVEDYSRSCPDGWSQSQQGCQSVGKSQCAGTYSFSSSSVGEKVNFANDCQAPWPCASTCSKNYSACPAGWISTGNGTCSGSAGDSDGCSDIYDFSAMSVGEKRQLTLACGLQWDCIASGHEQASNSQTKARARAGF